MFAVTQAPNSIHTGWPAYRAGAVLSVHLDAVVHNYRLLKARAPHAVCAAVVKADAYGLGAAQVAPALVGAGATQFFVAHVDEGLALRPHVGAQVGITVLHGPRPDAVEACLAHGLRPVLNSMEQIGWVRAVARQRQQQLGVVLQLDTGMSRFGLSADDVRQIAADPTLLDGLKVELVMSHLACADEPANPANAAQAARLVEYAAVLPVRAPLSLAASSGVFLGPDYHFDLVRPGAALYGVAPHPGAPNPLRAVVSLKAHVLQTRTLSRGDRVGYGLTWKAEGPCRVATIAVGYADGFIRARANGSAWFGGQALPILGRISMDSMTVDISAIPEGQLEADGMVELLNDTYGVDDVARAEGTIGYEVLTSLGHRYHRNYEHAA
ncbi:alanine racemase [Acetobacter okinawensis]|uniref:alanine racemase n=1 Tax=Acetobacter okinawensis TaxID=1076594 RepID=UPI001BA532A4|nr:alanine racemase [Acetobacter okinawensis]